VAGAEYDNWGYTMAARIAVLVQKKMELRVIRFLARN
jgi:hypothetical protein